MNVLMITPQVDLDNDVRGFIHSWVLELAKSCDNLAVIALYSGRTNLPKNVDLLPLNYNHNKFSTLFRLWSTLLKRLMFSRPDVVFCHMIPLFAILSAPVCRIFGVPVVLWYAHGATSLKLRLATMLVNRVVTPSAESFRLNSSKKRVLAHGIDTELFKPAAIATKRDFLLLLTVGRLSPSKDILTILAALAGFCESSKPRVKLHIVGSPFPNSTRDELYVRQLKKLVHDRGLEDSVQFLDSIPNGELSSTLQNCDIFINPSLTGSLDKSGLEAMACGKLLLTCNSSYLTILEPYSEKLFFAEKDPSDFKEKLTKLTQMDPVEYKIIASTLRSHVVENHSLSQLMSRLIATFDELKS